MRHLFFALALLGISSAPAFAADEFGARFGESAPSALDDTAQDAEILQLQNIAPAAGEQADEAAADSQNVLKEDPAQAILKEEALDAQEPAAGPVTETEPEAVLDQDSEVLPQEQPKN